LRGLVFFILCIVFAGIQVNARTADVLIAEHYLKTADSLRDQFRYDESIDACTNALKLSPNNAEAYSSLSLSYDKLKKWPEAIAAGENALRLNPQSPLVNGRLLYIYNEAKEWEKAEQLSKRILQLYPENVNVRENLAIVKANRESEKISKGFSNVLSLFILFCLGLVVYLNYKSPDSLPQHSGFPELLLIAASVSGLLYLIFYRYSTLIWSCNLKLPVTEYTYVIRQFSYEHDGIEGYVLYAFMFAVLLISFVLNQILSFVKNKTLYLLVFLLLSIISVYYYRQIGFTLPMHRSSTTPTGFSLPFFVCALTIALLLVTQKYLPKFLNYIVALLLLFICFIASEPMSMPDYAFIFAPALRLLDGFKLSEIYFQYDLLLSLLAEGWMKLKFSLNSFQVLGQLSYFLFFLGAFLFAKKFFLSKKMLVLFLISLVLIRYYSNCMEPVKLMQATPLRLDLWLIILLFLYYKGPYHWLTGLTIGFLVLTHKNMGLIYLASWLQLVLTLFLLDFKAGQLKENFKKHFSLNLINSALIALFILLSCILFKGFVAESAILYQQIGIGFIPIPENSFYWFMPVMFGIVFILLLKSRQNLSANYFTSGLLILYLAIGNSMYYFGRSHENNIICISGLLVFTLFLLVDLLNSKSAILNTASSAKSPDMISKKKSVKKITEKHNPLGSGLGPVSGPVKLYGLPLILILSTLYFYSWSINFKLTTQYKNFKKGQWVYPLNTVPKELADIKRMTNGSKKVYVMNYTDDFSYYYYGNYTPLGYFQPCEAWVKESEWARFLQNLLDQDYYLVTTRPGEIADMLPRLKFSKKITENGCTAISK